MPSFFEKALYIAFKAHQEQIDKAGEPYFFHPLRLAMQAHDEYLKATVILHDVLEDTSITLDELRQAGIPNNVLDAVVLMTRNQDETYHEFIQRIVSSRSYLAIAGKILDVRDNSDLTRLSLITDRDLNRNKKYAKALKILELSPEGIHFNQQTKKQIQEKYLGLSSVSTEDVKKLFEMGKFQFNQKENFEQTIKMLKSEFISFYVSSENFIHIF